MTFPGESRVLRWAQNPAARMAQHCRFRNTARPRSGAGTTIVTEGAMTQKRYTNNREASFQLSGASLQMLICLTATSSEYMCSLAGVPTAWHPRNGKEERGVSTHTIVYANLALILCAFFILYNLF